MAQRASKVERTHSFRTKTLRLHPTENAIITQACEALNGMERTQLVQEAVISEAVRLGVRWGVQPEPLVEKWQYMPERKGVTEDRVSVTVTLAVAELITRAAEHVHASEPMFIVGATLAHIGRLQKYFKGIHTTPEEACVIRDDLKAIKLPRQYTDI